MLHVIRIMQSQTGTISRSYGQSLCDQRLAHGYRLAVGSMHNSSVCLYVFPRNSKITEGREIWCTLWTWSTTVYLRFWVQEVKGQRKWANVGSALVQRYLSSAAVTNNILYCTVQVSVELWVIVSLQVVDLLQRAEVNHWSSTWL